jgi:hypothetical protein
MENINNMPKINLKEYVQQCVSKLCQRYKLNQDEFGYESDIHSDLYVILNTENNLFWDKLSVMMGSEANFKGSDLVITNPENESEEIYLEIKYIVKKKYIEKDLKRLDKISEGKGILLYIEDKEFSNKEIKTTLKELSLRYPKVDILYFHPEEENVISITNEIKTFSN